jgi:hypothetical protein
MAPTRCMLDKQSYTHSCTRSHTQAPTCTHARTHARAFTQTDKYVLLVAFPRNNYYASTRQCYAVRTLPVLFFSGARAQRESGPPHALKLLNHTQWHTRIGGTPLDEWSDFRKALYLATHNTHKWQTSVLPARFEAAIAASDRPETLALNRSTTGIGFHFYYSKQIFLNFTQHLNYCFCIRNVNKKVIFRTYSI